MNVNDQVNEAIRRWSMLVGIDPDAAPLDNWRPPKNSPWEGYTIINMARALNRSRELDPSGLSAFMLLRGITEHLLRGVKFTAHDIVLDAPGIEDQVAPMRALRDVLEHPDVVEMISEFQDSLRKAADHYDYAHRDALENLLADRWDLANVRSDALRSIEDRLEAHQFTWGESDPSTVAYSPDLFEFWNVNSILAAMRSQKVSGISVCLVRDPRHVMASYFVFAIRNGSTMTILTDRDETVHPAFNRMSRRPDREMTKRAERNWFPYDLLDLRTSPDGHLFAAERNQIVPINTKGTPIKPIRDLRAEEFVWTILMFDRIREKYWDNNLRVAELSYTGQMVVQPDSLVGAHAGITKTGHYKPLELPHLERKDVTAETTKDQWTHRPTGFNRWMVDRYGEKVPNEVFNVVGPNEARQLESTDAIAALAVPTKREASSILREDKGLGLDTLDPCGFGPKKQIEQDRLWVARMNQTRVIQRLAVHEFESEKESVLKWYARRLNQNSDMLVDACVIAEWVATDYDYTTWARDATIEQRNLLTQYIDGYPSGMWTRPTTRLGEWDDGGYRCFLTDRVANVYSHFRPTCPENLASLCRCTVKDLPWPMQHWYRRAPYYGNCILQRLDPEDWVLWNPWVRDRNHAGVDLDVGVYLCKSAVHARRKSLGLPKRILKGPAK